MKRLLIILFIFICIVAKSQNLVPNPSFEQIYSCPTNGSQFDGYVYDWFNPNGSTPNLLNECSPPFPINSGNVPYNVWGFQWARTGKGYTLIVVYEDYKDEGREYCSVKLDTNLEVGKKYIVGFYCSVSSADSITNLSWSNKGSNYSIDCLGLLFSDTAIHSSTLDTLPYIPQLINQTGNFLSDTVNWMLVSWEYIANGNEKYITIGNFKNNANTNHSIINPWTNSHGSAYYIDDVFVYAADEVQTAEAGSNITICKGDSTKIGMPTDTGYTYQWLPATGLSYDTIGDPWAHPTQTTTYYLHLNKYLETIDSVTITVINCDTINPINPKPNELIIINAFTPNNDGVNDVFHINGYNIAQIQAKVFNRWGQELYNWNELSGGWNGKYKGKEVSAGTYFYVITVIYNDGSAEEKKGAVTLIR